jgi:hypothetical protein
MTTRAGLVPWVTWYSSNVVHTRAQAALRSQEYLTLRSYSQVANISGRDHPSSIMITATMESVIHYRHSPEEIIDLEMATIPLMDSIKRVSTWQCRASMKRIVGCEFFRAREATALRNMLLRAVKFCRGHLDELFPLMRQDTLVQAQALEDATNQYWHRFQRLREETLPIH